MDKMTLDNTKNSLSLAYLVSRVKDAPTRAKAVKLVNELELRAHNLQLENKTLKLKLGLK